MTYVRNVKEGITIDVEVMPNSSKSEIYGFNEWRKRIQIKVKSEAKEGKANKEVIQLLSQLFEVPINKVTIVTGAKSRNKTIGVEGISESQAAERLRNVITNEI
jgi:uncharacterized protein (TIGR00251 family)